MTPGPLLLIIGTLLILSFLFSGMEAGVFALNRLRLRRMTRTGHAGAKLLHGYLENPEHFLWTILVGNTLSNFTVFSLVLMLSYHGLAQYPWLLVLVLLIFICFQYAFCDLLPKMLFRRFPNRLCLLFARPLRWVIMALAPLVSLLEWLVQRLSRWTGTRVFSGIRFSNREELRSVMQDSAQALAPEERAMIHRILDLQNLSIRQVAQPMTQVNAVTTQDTVEEAIRVCREKGRSRLPVWQHGSRPLGVAGVVTLKRLLYDDSVDRRKPVSEYLSPALLLEEDLRVEVALKRMRQGGHRLAMVVDHQRRPVGIVSLQDILKVMFGNLSL